MKTSEYIHAVIGSCRTHEQALLTHRWIRSVHLKRFDENKVEAYFQKKHAGEFAFSKALALLAKETQEEKDEN